MSRDRLCVVFTAIPSEFQAVRERLRHCEEVAHQNGTIYEVGDFLDGSEPWRVALLEAGPGNDNAGVEVERAVSFFQPECVLLIGVAGGLKDVSLGDVVAATKIYGYEGGKAGSEFLPRSSIGESAYELVQLARAVSRKQAWIRQISKASEASAFPEPKSFVGPIAAGEKVIASTAADAYQFLRRHYSDALAVEMEGAGFARAVHANRSLPSLVIRGISDLIDGKGAADAAGSQTIAARRAAAFAFEVLARYQPPRAFSFAEPQPPSPKASSRADAPDMWRGLWGIAADLYPEGPREDSIWERAGGDLSAIRLGSGGKADWFAALREVQRGGGGKDISAESLLVEMAIDYPRHAAIEALLSEVRQQGDG